MTALDWTRKPPAPPEPDWLVLLKGLPLLLWVVLGMAAMVILPLGGLYLLVRFVKWAWVN